MAFVDFRIDRGWPASFNDLLYVAAGTAGSLQEVGVWMGQPKPTEAKVYKIRYVFMRM